MRNSNITKIDSKGRILIPIHIRKILKADDGTEVVIIPDNEKRQARLLPLAKEKTAEFKLLMSDIPGALAQIANVFVDYNVDIIMSQSRTIIKGKLAEWDIIADISECNGNTNELRKSLMASKLIKSVELVKR